MQDDEKILNERISQLETEINYLYTDIGREYYESNPDHPQNDGMASCFQKIEERKAEIRDLNDQIQTLKGIIKCPHCGEEISKDNTFCPECGSRIATESTVLTEEGKCPNCGNMISPGQKFCPICGTKIIVSESGDGSVMKTKHTLVWDPEVNGVEEEPVTRESKTEETVASESVVEETEVEEEPVEEEPEAEESVEEGSSGVGVCKYCGKEYVKGMTFCIFCGKPIETSTDKEEPEPPPDMVIFDDGHDKEIVCPNCGRSVRADNQFCIYCGHRF